MTYDICVLVQQLNNLKSSCFALICVTFGWTQTYQKVRSDSVTKKATKVGVVRTNQLQILEFQLVKFQVGHIFPKDPGMS